MKAGQICPICQMGELKERKGKYGIFLGCSRYPSCAYVTKVEEEESINDKTTNEWLNQNGLTIDPII